MAPARHSWLRTASLIALAAVAVHQLRYVIAARGDAGAELAAHGHGYLADVLPLVAGFVLAGGAALVLRAATGKNPSASSGGAGRRTAAYAVAVYAVFSGQELLEGAFASGHPGGVDAVLSGGAWVALPLAVLAGALAAVLERRIVGIERTIARTARARRRRLTARPAPAIDPSADRAPASVTASPLALGNARRPPPLLLPA